MSSKPSNLQAVSYGDEASWGEASPTIDVRLQHIQAVDVAGLTPEMIDGSFVDQYAGGGYAVFPGPRGGSFSITLDLTGHGTDPASGTLTPTALFTLLSYVFGGSYSAGGGGVCDGEGTATTFTSAATGSDYSGWLIGALGDGRGGSQFHFTTNSGGDHTASIALEDTPDNNDVQRAALQVYPLSLPSGLVAATGLAFRLQTANIQYECHGCFCTGISLSGLNARERPQITLTFTTSWWEVVNETFPSATAVSVEDAAVVMNGSLTLTPASGSTRAAYNIRSFGITINTMMLPQESASASNQYQVITGAIHGGMDADIEIAVDAPASGTTTHRDNFGTNMKMMATFNSTPGKALGIYVPNMVWMEHPRQESIGNLNVERLRFKAQRTSVVSAAAAVAPFHLLMA